MESLKSFYLLINDSKLKNLKTGERLPLANCKVAKLKALC